MEENKDTQGLRTFIISVFMFLITVLCVGGMSFTYGLELDIIIRNTVLSGMGIGTVLLLMAQSKDNYLYDYDNRDYYGRFFICFFYGLMIASSCPLLPEAGWPFLTIFVLLTLFSNTLIGITCSTQLLLIAVLLSGAGIEVFALYFVSGVVAACLFRGLDDSYKVGIPLFLSLLILLVSETAGIVISMDERLSWELFFIPVINVIVSGIILIIILKIFSTLVIFKYREIYMEINDPECPLLVDLKQKSKEEYYKAVHTAYLSEKIAKQLKLNTAVAKAGGYYHRIGKLTGENNWENVYKICSEYRFPPQAMEVLEEFISKSKKISKKETAVIFFAEAVVSSILFLFSKDSEAKLDYDQVIDTVFKKKQESNIFSECEITIGELNTMKQMFKKEKLYYDFLR